MTDLKSMDKVLKFLPIFEKQGFSAGEVVANKGQFPYINYSPEVRDFISTLNESGLIRPFDWGSWQNEATRYFNDPAQLDSADIDTLSKLLTLHVRKERFCEGHLKHMLESGHIVEIFKRLRTIKDENHQPDL